jgi:hypothetical protein
MVLDYQGVRLLDHAQGVHRGGEQVVVDAHVRDDVVVQHDQAFGLLKDADGGDEVGIVSRERQELIASS